MTKINLTYCGMTGTGRTITEAKQDAARKLEAVMRMDYEPVILRWKGDVGACWNTPNGVVSGYMGENGRLSGTCFHGAGMTLEDAERSLRYALAQRNADIDSDEIPAILKGDKRLIADYTYWLGFQRACRIAQANNEPNYHQWACEHAREYSTLGSLASQLGKEASQNTVSDGFGNEWAAQCEDCGGEIQVVRPGKVQCVNCN